MKPSHDLSASHLLQVVRTGFERIPDHRAANAKIDLADALTLLAKFGDGPGDEDYIAAWDRVLGPQTRPFATAPAIGSALGITLQDVLANLRSFGHDCAPLPPG